MAATQTVKLRRLFASPGVSAGRWRIAGTWIMLERHRNRWLLSPLNWSVDEEREWIERNGLAPWGETRRVHFESRREAIAAFVLAATNDPPPARP